MSDNASPERLCGAANSERADLVSVNLVKRVELYADSAPYQLRRSGICDTNFLFGQLHRAVVSSPRSIMTR